MVLAIRLSASAEPVLAAPDTDAGREGPAFAGPPPCRRTKAAATPPSATAAAARDPALLARDLGLACRDRAAIGLQSPYLRLRRGGLTSRSAGQRDGRPVPPNVVKETAQPRVNPEKGALPAACGGLHSLHLASEAVSPAQEPPFRQETRQACPGSVAEQARIWSCVPSVLASAGSARHRPERGFASIAPAPPGIRCHCCA